MKHDGYMQLRLLVLAALVMVLAVFLFRGKSPADDWLCYPVNPSSRLPPQQPACFKAGISNTNLVTLEWRVSPSASAVYIYDDTAPDYSDIGAAPAVCRSGPGNGCSVQFRVDRGGYFRWILRVVGDDGGITHVAASLRVKAPFAPIEALGGGFVDMLTPRPRRLSWVVDPRNSFSDDTAEAWIEINEPENLLWEARHFPRTGPDAAFIAPSSAFLQRGSVAYQIRDCHIPSGSNSKFCSDPLTVSFRVGHDHFAGSHNVHVQSGSDYTLSFTTRSGNVRVLTSDTLLDPALASPLLVTTDSNYVIDGARLTPGQHRIELVSCKLPEWRCSNREDAEPAAMGGTALHMPEGFYHRGDIIAVVVSGDNQSMQTIHAPAAGEVLYEIDEVEERFHSVSAGDPVATVITRGEDVLHIEVDAPMVWEMGRDYTLDFYPAEAFATMGTGQALDIAFDEDGGIWQANEFSNNIEHVSPLGQVASLNLPLGRNPDSEPNSAVRPFTLGWGADRQSPVSVSSLAEHISASGSKIWLTQGGGLVLSDSPVGPNHSRVISFDRAGLDLPATEYDDRFCVYNIPADDEEGHGNNQIIGLALSAGRVWIAESRGLLSDSRSYISSFVPNLEQCDNVLNFDDRNALRQQSLQYCGDGRTPEQDGCIEKMKISGFPGHVKVAHLHADPGEGVVWFNDACGKCLGSLDPANGGDVTIYEINDKHDRHLDGMQGLGGFPWGLELDREAVYTGEYATRHILRLDKATGTYSEVKVPFDNPDVRLHSLAIDRLRERLWFTLTNETPSPINPAASTVGYVDLSNWRSHVEDPVRNPTIHGVIYRGLDQLPPEDDLLTHQAFRGIAVDKESGKVALATMWREQITVLTPLPGFWP